MRQEGWVVFMRRIIERRSEDSVDFRLAAIAQRWQVTEERTDLAPLQVSQSDVPQAWLDVVFYRTS